MYEKGKKKTEEKTEKENKVLIKSQLMKSMLQAIVL